MNDVISIAEAFKRRERPCTITAFSAPAGPSSDRWPLTGAAKLVHKTGKSEKTSTSLPAATFVGMLDQIRREFRAKGR